MILAMNVVYLQLLFDDSNGKSCVFKMIRQLMILAVEVVYQKWWF